MKKETTNLDGFLTEAPKEAPKERISKYEETALIVREKSLSFQITDERTATIANNGRRKIKEILREFKTFISPMEDSAKMALASVRDQKAKVEKPLLEADSHFKTEIEDYFDRIERTRREAERKANEEREEALRKAQVSEDEGKPEEAAAALDTAIQADYKAEQVAFDTPAPALEKTSISKRWTYEVTDPKKVPRKYCIPDTAQFSKIAQGLKGADVDPPKISGVHFYQKTVASTRGF